MSETFKSMDPFYGIFDNFEVLLNSAIVKYNYIAEDKETFESKRNADGYLAAVKNVDTFYSYPDYTRDELIAVGITDNTMLHHYLTGDGILDIPERYRDALLNNRRRYVVTHYNELNEYYRKLNGLPPLSYSSNKFHYLSEEDANKLGIDKNIPIHKIRDHYNNIESGKGDYLISVIDGLGIIDNLFRLHRDEEYIYFIGKRRISISLARTAKNFQLLHLEQGTAKDSLYDEFVKTYEQCRDYFVVAIYVSEYRKIIPYYDKFIAMCIMLMAILTTINRQFPLGIRREFFNNYTLKMLYDAYGVPYDLNIDEYTQKRIAQNLNLIIQKKSTDKVIFDIAELLGFDNLDIYRYYLGKERKFDIYGIPVIAYTQKFNDETGEYETVPDYSKMNDLYFQKVKLGDKDYQEAFNDKTNRVSYEEVTTGDPFWWNDDNTFRQIWEREYNYVESKYLSLGISYRMSDILYENIMLLRLLMENKDSLDSIKFTLPKINPSIKIGIFDAIILLLCLTSKKHHLIGEIIAIPTQVLSVLDYLHNTDSGDEYAVDSFGFNFKYFDTNNAEGQKAIHRLQFLLNKYESKEEAEKFMNYIKTLTINKDLPDSEKITLINTIYNNAKRLSKFLQYEMAKTKRRDVYEMLRQIYRAGFYAKEVKDLFTIYSDDAANKRTAKNYFEFLHDYNYPLYSSIFTENYEEQYNNYIKKNKLSSSTYTLNNFKEDVKYGKIDDFTYSTLNTQNKDITVSDELIYYYIDHIISRLEEYVKDLRYIYLLNDTSTPLEDLLIKMINFFKSFTVDLLGLDIIYITDMRADNIMRFFDEIYYMRKLIEPHEHIHLSYADTLHRVISNYKFRDTFKLYSKEFHDKDLIIASDRMGNHYNYIHLRDDLKYNKDIDMKSDFNMTDVSHLITSDVKVKDTPSHEKDTYLFNDRVILYYDE